jgi:hypothetical protein
MAWRRDPRLQVRLAIDENMPQLDFLTVLLKVLLTGSHELDSSELVAVLG